MIAYIFLAYKIVCNIVYNNNILQLFEIFDIFMIKYRLYSATTLSKKIICKLTNSIHVLKQ